MINKLARTITSILPVDSRRDGSCNNCGACCKLPFRCAFLKTDGDGKSFCSAYKFRPLNCRKFPRTAAQLEPVADVCGFSFRVEVAETKKATEPAGYDVGSCESSS
jgi:hypothetical protein